MHHYFSLQRNRKQNIGRATGRGEGGSGDGLELLDEIITYLVVSNLFSGG